MHFIWDKKRFGLKYQKHTLENKNALNYIFVSPITITWAMTLFDFTLTIKMKDWLLKIDLTKEIAKKF